MKMQKNNLNETLIAYIPGFKENISISEIGQWNLGHGRRKEFLLIKKSKLVDI